MELDGMLNEDNNLNLDIKPEIFIELLRYFNIGTEFSPIGTEFEGDKVLIRVDNNAGDASAVFDGEFNFNTKEITENGEYAKQESIGKLEHDGYLVIEPIDLLKRFGSKFNHSEHLYVNAIENQKIHFRDEKGAFLKEIPIDKTLVKMPKLSKLPHFDANGDFLGWPKKDNGEYIKENGEQVYIKPTTKIKILASELQKAVHEMKAADRDYVEYSFKKDDSFASSGHLGKEKSNHESGVPIQADVEGDELKIVFQEVFTDIIKVLNGEITIYGKDGIPVVIITKSLPYGKLIYTVSEPEAV